MKQKPSSLQPLRNSSLAEQVEERLMLYLKENRFKAGDALPKEIELAEYLGVSRNIIREALSRLRMLGIIESKKRKGMVITEPDIFGGVERVMDPDLLGENTMKDVFELRLVLEVGMGDLLFIRKTPEDIKILEDIAERESNDPECINDIKRRLSYEVEFHGHLYSMSGNNTLLKFQSMLLPVFHFMMEQEAKLTKKPISSNVSHKDLIETLKTGTSEDFRESMRIHLSPHYQKLS